MTFQAPRAPEPMCEVAPDRFLVSVEVACRNHRQRDGARAEFLGLLQEPYSSQDTDRGTETRSRKREKWSVSEGQLNLDVAGKPNL